MTSSWCIRAPHKVSSSRRAPHPPKPNQAQSRFLGSSDAPSTSAIARPSLAPRLRRCLSRVLSHFTAHRVRLVHLVHAAGSWILQLQMRLRDVCWVGSAVHASSRHVSSTSCDNSALFTCSVRSVLRQYITLPRRSSFYYSIPSDRHRHKQERSRRQPLSLL